MAKKAAAPKATQPAADTASTVMSVKMTVAFRDWLNELATFDRCTTAQAMEKGAILYAQKVGFTKPAPMRTK